MVEIFFQKPSYLLFRHKHKPFLKTTRKFLLSFVLIFVSVYLPEHLVPSSKWLLAFVLSAFPFILSFVYGAVVSARHKSWPRTVSSVRIVAPTPTLVAGRDFSVIEGATLINEGQQSVQIDRAFPVVFDVPLTRGSQNANFFLNGYTSFSGTGGFRLDEKEIDSLVPHLRQVHRNMRIPKGTEPGQLTSALFGVIQPDISKGNCIVVGSLDCTKYFAQITTQVITVEQLLYCRVSVQIQIEVSFFFSFIHSASRQGLELAPGAKLNLPAVYLAVCKNTGAIRLPPPSHFYCRGDHKCVRIFHSRPKTDCICPQPSRPGPWRNSNGCSSRNPI